MTKEAKILIAIAVVVVVGGVLLAIFANPQPQEPGAPVDSQSLIRENSHMTKQSSAKVNLVEFGDFQCPGCAAASPRMKEIIELYKDSPDFNFVFRNFPLDTIHPNAQIAAQAAEAAGAQGKYWEMHHLLFEKQGEWGTMPDPLNTFVTYAESLGLNSGEFRTAVGNRLYAEVIKADQSDGNAVGVKSTPTFFLNGVKIESPSVPTVDELKAKIDEALAK
jgi:protein-disulfide isomerase